MALTRYTTRRRLLEGTAALGAAALVLPGKAPAQGGALPLSGVTLNVSTFSAPFPKFLIERLPEFEAATGAKVNYDTPAFPVYNQRADLELSTGGSAYDVLNVTFIYSSRWIGAGWFTPLDEFLDDPEQTAADFDVEDFLPGLRRPESDKDGRLHAVPWTVDAYIAGAARNDLVKAAGLALPDTTDDVVKVLSAVKGQDETAGFVTENHPGWSFIPYLQGLGGNVFRNPPDDLMPVLDTPEAIAAAEYYARILREFGPNGVLSYTNDQCLQALRAGRVVYTTNGQTYVTPIGDPSSATAATAAFSLVPRGPAGRFPGVAVHGFGIPAGSNNKEAAWRFIQWATSKEKFARAVAEKGYSAPTRRSVIESPEFRRRMTLNGHDVAGLILDSVDLAARQGHMTYRTIHVYPQVDKQIDKAIELIASNQLSAEQAMRQAQAGSINDLKRNGVRV